MLPRFDPTFARPHQPPSPAEISRRQRILTLQREANTLRIELATAAAIYARTLSPVDLLRQQRCSMALERCLSQLRQMARS